MFLNIGVGISTFITNFNTIVSTFRDWFRRVGMSARGWRIVFPHSRGTALVSVRSETLLQSSDVICARSQHCLLLLRYVFRVTVRAFWSHFVFLTDESLFRFQSQAAQLLAVLLLCSGSARSFHHPRSAVHSLCPSSTGCQLLHNSPCSTLLLTYLAQLV
jgi:hypothetical protein